MLEADFIPILGQPQLDACSQVVSNPQKQLIFLFSLKGKDALSFSKDISNQIKDWQISSPEELHQHLLDLQQFCRQEKLEINYAAMSLLPEKVIFASKDGSIFIKREAQFKQLIDNSAEIKLLVGHLRKDDQIYFSTTGENLLFFELGQLLNHDQTLSQESLASQLTLYNSEHNHVDNAIVMAKIEELNEQTSKPVNNKKVWPVVFAQLKSLLKNFYSFLLALPEKFKQLISKIKKINWKKWRKFALPVLLLLIISITLFIFQQQNIKQAMAKTKTEIASISQELDDLSNLVEKQPLTARQKAQTVLSQLQELGQKTQDKESKKLVNTAIEQVEKLIKEISGQNSLDQLSIAFNLKDYADNFLGQELFLNNGNLYILENNRREILKINIASKENQILAIPEDKTVRAFSVTEGQIYFLADGIWQMDVSDPNQYQRLKDEGDSDRAVQLMTAFGPYLYLVNSERRNIYRFYYQNEELSEAIGWLTDKEGLIFSEISDISVDGDLWLAFKDGSLKQYNRGEATDFAIQGLAKNFSSPLSISTQENNARIAVLAKEEKRLAVINKNGQFLSEINSNELAGVNDIALAADSDLVYALSGSIVYQLTF